eukprot:m.1552260 g.1552260  ORF g.1552260 m.1552260 type:complete len:65 (+) comp25267_c4_seq10:288-482(+)
MNIVHYILASLRSHGTTARTQSRYAIPYVDWFHWVSSPHYFGEILIYASIALLLLHAPEAWQWL